MSPQLRNPVVLALSTGMSLQLLLQLWTVASLPQAAQTPPAASPVTVIAPAPPPVQRNSPVVPTPAPAEVLVQAAKVAFSKQPAQEERGIALLSAALALQPHSVAGLDLYQEVLRGKYVAALEQSDWNLARTQLLILENTIQAGLADCQSETDVTQLLERLQVAKKWTTEFHTGIQRELADIQKRLEGPPVDESVLQGLRIRIETIPATGLPDPLTSQLLTLATRVAERQLQGEQRELQAIYLQLKGRSEKADVDLSTLRELQAHAEHLLHRVLGVQSQQTFELKLIGNVRELCDQLDQFLQVRSLRAGQQLSDQEARNSLQLAQELLTKAKSSQKSRKFQAAGQSLAEAELLLGQVDRLSSLPVQKQARELGEQIAREAIGVRVQQQRMYNLWAITQLELSLADYKAAQGYFANDKEAFKKSLRERVGVIDPQLLHPATHALYTEMFQRLYSGLDNANRAEITKAIELTDKKPLSDDLVSELPPAK